MFDVTHIINAWNICKHRHYHCLVTARVIPIDLFL